MRYIVWRTPFKSYGYEQGDGYFVKWKNKCEDEFSTNWFDANKYKTIGTAIKRLGLKINLGMNSLDDFYKENPITKSFQRDKTISEIIGENQEHILLFEKGFIDKIDDNGNYIGNAGKEVSEYLQNFFDNNVKQHNIILKKFSDLGVDNYIDKSISDEDFWIEVLKK